MINWIGLFIFVVCLAGLLSSQVTATASEKAFARPLVRIPLTLLLLALGLVQADFWPGNPPLTLSFSGEVLKIVTLWVHEAGHALFSFGGEVFGVLGGTLLQVMVPLGAAIYLALIRGCPSIGWIMLFWLGHGLKDSAVYIADARAMALPLLGGADIHDWNYLLSRWGLLEQDQLIAKIVRVVSILIMCYALVLLALFSSSVENKADQPETNPAGN